MILVVGGLADSVTELVCARLADCGYPYQLLDLARYPADYRLEWRWPGEYPEGYIATDGWRLGLEEINAVYVRWLGESGRLPSSGAPQLAATIHAEADAALGLLLEQLPCLVVNRQRGGWSNQSKPYQAQIIAACGLRVPPTLVTSDPDAARRFYDEYGGEVIYKSISGVRSIVRRVDAAQLARLDLLRQAPTQFQAYIGGDNVRVHVVGKEVIATRVLATAVDYRYAAHEGSEVSMEPTDLPTPIAAACCELARRLDLALVGIDLKQTADGEYYCFEANPMPAFSYYELNAGQPISLALAELLQQGQREMLDLRIGGVRPSPIYLTVQERGQAMEEHQSNIPPQSSGGQPASGGNVAFIPASERPTLALNPERPFSELTVRDLQQIVAEMIRQNIAKLLVPENVNPPSVKSGKDMGQEQPGNQPVITNPQAILHLATSLNQMTVNQMALTREVAALQAEVEQLKNK